MGLAVLLLQRRHRSVEPFESQTIKEWVTRAMGAQAWDKIWGPLLWGKFRDEADRISMSWLWSSREIFSATLALGSRLATSRRN